MNRDFVVTPNCPKCGVRMKEVSPLEGCHTTLRGGISLVWRCDGCKATMFSCQCEVCAPGRLDMIRRLIESR